MSPVKYVCTVLLFLAVFIPVSAVSFADQSGKIIVGVIPEVNLVKQMERYTPLAEYLEEKTGIEVDIRPLANYGQLYEEMRDGNIDAGFFGSMVYCLTRARIGVVPLVRPVQPNGKSTYTGVLFARKDAGIKKLADMKGKTIALVDPATAAGYLAQREFFAEHGIDMEKELKVHWAGSHEAAIRAVLSDQAALGGAKDTVVAKFRKMNRTFDSLVTILNVNPKIGLPDTTFAVRKELDMVTRAKLKKTLLAMNSDPAGRKVLAKFGAVSFIPTSDADFKPMYAWFRHLKIDLTTYPYKR